MITRNDMVQFLDHVTRLDFSLDAGVGDAYKQQPLAQDWARIAKIGEEAGEALDALIGVTGQNPRKGIYSSQSELFNEIADAALTAIYGLQHFTKDADLTRTSSRRKSWRVTGVTGNKAGRGGRGVPSLVF